MADSMDQSHRHDAAVCQQCGECVPDDTRESEIQSNAPQSSPSEHEAVDRDEKRSSKGQQPADNHLLVHGDSRLGHLFAARANGNTLQQRVLLRQYISDWMCAAKQAYGVNILVVSMPCCMRNQSQTTATRQSACW
jgi:hypothetical protein